MYNPQASHLLHCVCDFVNIADTTTINLMTTPSNVVTTTIGITGSPSPSAPTPTEGVIPTTAGTAITELASTAPTGTYSNLGHSTIYEEDKLTKIHDGFISTDIIFNPFKPEFTIVIFIHYKPRIAAAILDLEWTKMTWCGLKIKDNYHVSVSQFHGNFRSKTLSCRKIKYVFRDVKWCFNALWSLKGLKEVSNQITYLWNWGKRLWRYLVN